MNTDNLVLRPNCLLTKLPIVFVTGPRSLFHYEKMGHDLQDFIAAHGYQVTPLYLPFRSANLRLIAFNNWLTKKTNQNFHFIVSLETLIEFKSVFAQIKATQKNSTITVIDSTNSPVEKNIDYFFLTQSLVWYKIPILYQLHKVFCYFSGITAVKYENNLLGVPTTNNNAQIFDRFLDHCIHLAENET